MMTAYILTLSVAVLFALITASAKRDESLARCAFVILGNWVVGMAISLTGWTDAWPVNIPLDAAAAFIILRHPAARWQAVLGPTYCLQILMHIGYALALYLEKGADAMTYYNQLTGVAFLQLAILGGWSIDLWGSRHRRTDRRLHAAAPGAPRLAEPR